MGTELKGVALPASPATLLRFVSNDELDELERLVLFLESAPYPPEAPALKRAEEIMRLAYSRMETGHSGF